MSTGQSRSIRTLPREPITGAPTRTVCTLGLAHVIS
jgi:hypothetical protein